MEGDCPISVHGTPNFTIHALQDPSPSRSQLYTRSLGPPPTSFTFHKHWESWIWFRPNWKLFHSVYTDKRFPLRYRTTFLKVTTLALPVGHRTRRFKNADTQCPNCTGYETILHCFFTCPRLEGLSSQLFQLVESFTGVPPSTAYDVLFYEPSSDEDYLVWFSIFLVYVHIIWNIRNEVKYKGILPKPTALYAHLILSSLEFNVHSLFLLGQRREPKDNGTLLKSLRKAFIQGRNILTLSSGNLFLPVLILLHSASGVLTSFLVL